MKQYKQKEFIYMLSKSKDITLTELSIHLKLELGSFRKTLKRSNLKLSDFLSIYEYIYKDEFKTDSEFLNVMKEMYGFTLNQFVDAMEIDGGKKVFVTLYRNTKIQLIN